MLLSLDLSDERTAAVPHTERYVPISWVHEVGKGRVFFCSLGHEHDIFWTPAILRHLLDGIQFALGDLQASAEPAEADRNWAFDALIADQSGDVQPVLDAIAEQVKAAGRDAKQLAAIEQQMLRVLRSEASVAARRAICEPLSHIASEASIPVAVPLLVDPELQPPAAWRIGHCLRIDRERGDVTCFDDHPGVQDGDVKGGGNNDLFHLLDRDEPGASVT